MNKSYAICYNSQMKNSTTVLESLKSLLISKQVRFDVLDIDNLESGYDFAFVIGGDGTILKAARFFAEFETPIFGINLGRLGFLSQSSLEDLEKSMEAIFADNYKIEKRMMLQANNHNALNDFVIKGDLSSRTSHFALKINGKFVCEYMADGIIISTPTGSTAYGMAAGGPILAPDVDAITIVPICPHTFSARPIVVSDNDEITILPCENNEYKVSADGQIVFSLNEPLVIKKSTHRANLALLADNDFYSILRNKLQWGYSPAKI
ncbi:MAG: NAD(+) kinase [Cyanobacteria bacterium SIG26]|nr:NAD(+) kinase [Cyanobacteria bacterium SIG26]